MFRCVLCDTPIESESDMERCPECGADPVTGMELTEGFVPLSVLTQEADMTAEELLLLTGVGSDDMDLVNSEERRIERLQVA